MVFSEFGVLKRVKDDIFFLNRLRCDLAHSKPVSLYVICRVAIGLLEILVEVVIFCYKVFFCLVEYAVCCDLTLLVFTEYGFNGVLIVSHHITIVGVTDLGASRLWQFVVARV